MCVRQPRGGVSWRFGARGWGRARCGYRVPGSSAPRRCLGVGSWAGLGPAPLAASGSPAVGTRRASLRRLPVRRRCPESRRHRPLPGLTESPRTRALTRGCVPRARSRSEPRRPRTHSMSRTRSTAGADSTSRPDRPHILRPVLHCRPAGPPAWRSCGTTSGTDCEAFALSCWILVDNPSAVDNPVTHIGDQRRTRSTSGLRRPRQGADRPESTETRAGRAPALGRP